MSQGERYRARQAGSQEAAHLGEYQLSMKGKDMATSYALRPAWTPLTILLMVLGFIMFWPLGLAMLAYILWR